MAKAPAKSGKKKSFKKKEKRVVHTGVVHVQATFNNTIITITDGEGNTLSWSSSGSLGFRGSRKGTPFAAQQAALTAANKATEVGLRSVEVRENSTGTLVAGELGYTLGSTYTSLSGFFRREDRKWNHYGKLQLVMLAEALRDAGYAFWNLGHPHMAYKTALGARILPRHEFLNRWRVAITEGPQAKRGSGLPRA